MVIDPARRYTATIVTDLGDIVIELFADKAPTTVNNFVFLAREGYYDGVTFHRVINGFMAQTGDPTGSGAEARLQVRRRVPPRAAARWARRGEHGQRRARHQRLAVLHHARATPHLDDRHTVFGRVVEGMDVVLAIPERDPRTASRPGTAMKRVEITEEDPEA